ncbi:hypothetical protein [Paenibacillus sp. YN15]|nr:hypothetical protein [Paenibacillus sp. YN15]
MRKVFAKSSLGLLAAFITVIAGGSAAEAYTNGLLALICVEIADKREAE